MNRRVVVGLWLVLLCAGHSHALGVEDNKLDQTVVTRSVAESVRAQVVSFAQGPTSQNIDAFFTVFERGVVDPAMAPMIRALRADASDHPIVLLISVANVRRMLLLRRAYGWIDPVDLELHSIGRVRTFWTVWIADRGADVTHTVTVETRPAREFAFRRTFDPVVKRPIDEVTSAEAELTWSIGFKQFTTAYSPASVVVSFASYDRVTFRTQTTTETFRAPSDAMFDMDVNLMWAVARSSASVFPLNSPQRAFVTFSLMFGGMRDRDLGSTTVLAFYPNVALGIGIPADVADTSSPDEGAFSKLTYYLGYQFPIRGTPVNLDVGFTSAGPTGHERAIVFGLSLAVKRTLDRLSGR
jgi:hypothetical protein